MSDQKLQRLKDHAEAALRQVAGAIEYPEAASGFLRSARFHAEKAAALIDELRGETGGTPTR